ncbi:5-amino-6-(5-phospho-D-ribitylamino)uracil phosphatase YigB [Photobacterium sp. 1_MG-2023]|uniref:5-amino-6-(5-phospho-D-ribitylamino)uracil phosphatase YigB n=1 Tax=Photobacterium sp. 1_MG-2023 TaxID=3062646 RepID=UPI0026E28635|nr:5-amino-6-(5-phospho-D-ribitylamino)uracil phosphatase YigB [Photobacterium sp. 1_MG-2023]MDO6708285.1 5-amino-6-(5-phospho-D-ribitylamino)uracil phosphatase YigB [Photobacterium sp. 1_MG-2023]
MQFYRSFRTPKAMTFDLDDTLYDNHPVIQRTERAMHDWLAQSHPASKTMSPGDWQQLKYRLARENPMLRHDVTEWRRVMLRTGLMALGYTPDLAAEATEEGLERVLTVRNQVDVPAQTHEVMAELARRVPLLAITNGNVDADKIGLGQYFSRVLVAGRDGLSKPEPDLFAQAQALLGVAPQDILHVGDHLVSDVEGARRSGFQACWLNDQQRQLHQEARLKGLPDVEIHTLSQLLQLV